MQRRSPLDAAAVVLFLVVFFSFWIIDQYVFLMFSLFFLYLFKDKGTTVIGSCFSGSPA